MASSHGVGNFRSMLINIPNSNEKGIQLIPVGDIATKGEYKKIKNVTAQEVIPACEMFMDAVNRDLEVPKNLHLTFNLDNVAT